MTRTALTSTFVLLAACATEGNDPETILGTTGLQLELGVDPQSDVTGIRYVITPVDCGTGDPVGDPIVDERTLVVQRSTSTDVVVVDVEAGGAERARFPSPLRRLIGARVDGGKRRVFFSGFVDGFEMWRFEHEPVPNDPFYDVPGARRQRQGEIAQAAE